MPHLRYHKGGGADPHQPPTQVEPAGQVGCQCYRHAHHEKSIQEVRKKWYIQRLMPLFQGDKSIITDLTAWTPPTRSPWKPNLANLEACVRYLNARRYTALHYTGPGTNLTVGLPEGHL